jgi:hypothetical protein
MRHLHGIPMITQHIKGYFDAPQDTYMDLIVSPKVKTLEGEGVGARSLVRNILGVEGRVRAPR